MDTPIFSSGQLDYIDALNTLRANAIQNLVDASDVNLAGLADGTTLVYNASTGKFDLVAAGSGSGSGSTFTLGASWDAPTASGYLMDHILKVAVDFPSNLAGSEMRLRGTVAAANMVFQILHINSSGTTINSGTATITAGQSVATFSFTGGMGVPAGNAVQIVAPSVADATGRNVTVTLVGAKV